MEEKLGDDAEEVLKALGRHGIPQGIGRQAVKLVEGKGRFTIYALVDAVTRIAREITNAGDRTELDQKALGSSDACRGLSGDGSHGKAAAEVDATDGGRGAEQEARARDPARSHQGRHLGRPLRTTVCYTPLHP